MCQGKHQPATLEQFAYHGKDLELYFHSSLMAFLCLWSFMHFSSTLKCWQSKGELPSSYFFSRPGESGQRQHNAVHEAFILIIGAPPMEISIPDLPCSVLGMGGYIVDGDPARTGPWLVLHTQPCIRRTLTFLKQVERITESQEILRACKDHQV